MAASFQNMATLSYNGGTVNSNIVTGVLQEVLTAVKTAVLARYVSGGTVTYVVSITNSGTAAFTGLTLSDDLGGYTFNGVTLYPLALEADSVRYYVNGVLQAAPAVTAGPPMTVTGITVPAGGNAQIIYETRITRYAPLALESTVVNTVSITGGGLANAVTAQETIGADSGPALSITKGLSPTVVAENGSLTYSFTIQNSGNTAAAGADAVILRDTFDPILKNIAVTFNGTAWTADTDYTYDAATGEFTSVAGSITVPAAAYTQDAVTGVWSVTPGTGTLVITGTV